MGCMLKGQHWSAWERTPLPGPFQSLISPAQDIWARISHAKGLGPNAD